MYIESLFICMVNSRDCLGPKKLGVFPVTRPTLIFCSDPKIFITFEDKMPENKSFSYCFMIW